MKVTLLLQLVAAISAPPAGVQNARMTVRAVAAGGLSADVRSLSVSPGPSWLGYSQAVVGGPRQMCCFGSGSSGTFRGLSKTCRDDPDEQVKAKAVFASSRKSS